MYTPVFPCDGHHGLESRLRSYNLQPEFPINTLTVLQSSRSPNGNSPKGCGNSHVTPSKATTTDTIFNYGYRRFYRCIVRFLWVVGAKVPWSSNWASKQLRNRKRVNFFNTWPVLSTKYFGADRPICRGARSCIVWQI